MNKDTQLSDVKKFLRTQVEEMFPDTRVRLFTKVEGGSEAQKLVAIYGEFWNSAFKVADKYFIFDRKNKIQIVLTKNVEGGPDRYSVYRGMNLTTFRKDYHKNRLDESKKKDYEFGVPHEETGYNVIHVLQAEGLWS